MSVRLRPRCRDSGCGGTLRRFPISLSSSRTISWESGERLIHSVPRLLRKTRDVCARGPPLQPYFVVFEKFLTLPLYRRHVAPWWRQWSQWFSFRPSNHSMRDKNKLKRSSKVLYVLLQKRNVPINNIIHYHIVRAITSSDLILLS